MTHQLIKRGPRDWYCEICHQSWTSESKAWCPGVPIISYANRGGLMSKTELGKRGFKNGNADLPPSPCSYRMNTAKNDVLYVKLYDPTQCTPKRIVKHKVVHHVDHLAFPVRWFPFLDEMTVWRRDHLNEKGILAWTVQRAWYEKCIEMARMVSPLLFYTRADIEALAGEVADFVFPLSPIRAQWEMRGPSVDQAEALIDLLTACHRNWVWDHRPPPTEDELEARRLKRERHDRESAERLAEFNARKYDLPAWMTQDEAALPPPVQLSMFGEG